MANEILKQENLLENPDTEVNGVAMEKLVDGRIPVSFPEGVFPSDVTRGTNNTVWWRCRKGYS